MSSHGLRSALVAALVTIALAAGLAACALSPSAHHPPATTTDRRAATHRAAATGHAGATIHTPSMTATTGALAQARRTHEYPTPAPAPRTAGGWLSPALAVQWFALGYTNWTWRTVVSRLRLLAQLSVGQARSIVTLQAAETARDYELRRGEIVNRGAVEAVAALAGQRDRYVVVTREQTTAQRTDAYDGLAPAWQVSLATVTRLGHLWVVSGWQPES